MAYQDLQNNRVYLYGRTLDAPTFSHEVLGEKFYDLTLGVQRLSGQEDEIPLTISDRLLETVTLEVGDYIALDGQFRSYNRLDAEKSKLVLKVFVRELLPEYDEDNPNVIELVGYVCKPPIYRTTPFKREICDLLLAVNRAYNKSDYIPTICWGRNARYAGGFGVGDRVCVSGRIQSRKYTKNFGDGKTEERTAYEVSVAKIEAATE